MLRSARAQQCQTNTPAPLARRPVVTVPAGASAMGGCQSSPRMGASRVAGSVYFSFSSCPVRPGSICQASSGWGRRGGGAEELFLGVHARVGGARAPAWAGRGAGGGTVVQLRRLVRGAPWRREGDGVGARGFPSGCGQGRGQRRGATRQPVQYCGALTMARARPMTCGWNPMPTNWKICSLVTR